MSWTVAAAAVFACAVLTAPHLLPLHRARPTAGIVVWLLVLGVRAMAAVALATAALAGLAEVALVRALLDWCWHEVLPNVPRALGFDEHPVTHTAVAAPAAALAASLLSLVVALAQGLRAKRRLLAREVGPGPLDSTVIRHDGVVLAVTALGRGRVLVSDRALGELDADELTAGLVHEHAHLRRRHRPVVAAGALLAAVARLLPGTRAAQRDLRFHVERDADYYTVRLLDDPLALASAICKAAVPEPRGALAGLGGRGRLAMRLDELLDGRRTSRGAERGAWALSVVLLAVLLALATSLPAWAVPQNSHRDGMTHGCEHSE